MNFEPGTVVVFNPDSFNPEFWNKLPEKDRIKYYGCILVDLDDGHIETMRHTSDFREVYEEEF
jgi:hypothetical protein